MDKKEKILTSDQFSNIFKYNTIQNVLLMGNKSYPCIYYFMRSFIAHRYYIVNETFSGKKHEKLNRLYLSTLTNIFFILKNAIKYSSKHEDKLQVIFLSRNRFPFIITPSGEKIRSDYLFGTTINQMKKMDKPYKIGFISMSIGHLPSINDINVISIFEYGSLSILFKSIFSSINYFITWRMNKLKIITHIKEQKCDYIIPFFYSFFNIKQLFFDLFCDYCLQNMLNKNQPLLLVANDDVMSSKPKTVLRETKLIIMQSASLDQNKEKCINMFLSNYSVLEDMMADAFLVLGEEYKKIKQTTRDSKEVLIIGQPRYDTLHYANKIYNKNNICSSYKINSNNKIILWTTQCHGMDIEENKKNLECVCNAIDKMEKVTLVIKQHPDEEIFYTRMIENYIVNYDITAQIIFKSSDVYELLFISDLLITKDSTTATEAILLNKPVIIMNLSGKPDVQDYVKEGVAFGVYKKNDLKPAIEKLLETGIYEFDSRDLYIKKYLYKNDGKATERIIELIDKNLSGL